MRYSHFYLAGFSYAIKEASAPLLPGKFKLKEKSITQIDSELRDPKYVMEPKIDGVGVAVFFEKGRPLRIFTAEPKKTGIREHTEKIPELRQFTTPPELDKTIVRGELFAVDSEGKAIPANRIIGLVNATPEKSLERQKELGVRFRIAPFSFVRLQGKRFLDRPYSEHLVHLPKLKKVPSFVSLPSAQKEDEKRQLLNEIKARTFPLTQEGVVFHHLEKPKEPAIHSTIKAKFRPDYDVYVRNIFPAKGEAAGLRAGGFEFSWTPNGPIVGRVGTGFDHTTLADMLKHPERYIGRVAKVRSVQVFERAPGKPGALRAPSFVGWHLEKGEQVLE